MLVKSLIFKLNIIKIRQPSLCELLILINLLGQHRDKKKFKKFGYIKEQI
jgi:hypothetical protein